MQLHMIHYTVAYKIINNIGLHNEKLYKYNFKILNCWVKEYFLSRLPYQNDKIKKLFEQLPWFI